MSNTERRLERFRQADLWPSEEALACMLDNQSAAISAVRSVIAPLADAADQAALRLEHGAGRIIYVGAGASGRLAVQDGVELFPTFSWPHDRLVYLMAGGEKALVSSIEGAEDDANQGTSSMRDIEPSHDDVVIALAASGRTPFTIAAAQEANRNAALTITFANNPKSALLQAGTNNILLDTGAEFLAGSTRMTAGTAQKIALNLLSTQIMNRLGRIHDGWMVDVVPSNDKLVARSKRIIQSLVDVDDDGIDDLWMRSGENIKTAVLIAEGATSEQAHKLLDECGGRLGLARRHFRRNNE